MSYAMALFTYLFQSPPYCLLCGTTTRCSNHQSYADYALHGYTTLTMLTMLTMLSLRVPTNQI